MKAHFIDYSPMKILLEDEEYFLEEFSMEQRVIPKSYAYDWLSIPRVFQWLVNMNLTQNIRAWLIHDFEYSQLSEVSFREANRRLRENLDCTFLSKWIIWLWVTLFGTLSYKRDSNYNKYKKQITNARKELWFQSLSIKI